MKDVLFPMEKAPEHEIRGISRVFHIDDSFSLPQILTARLVNIDRDTYTLHLQNPDMEEEYRPLEYGNIYRLVNLGEFYILGRYDTAQRLKMLIDIPRNIRVDIPRNR